MAQGAGEPLLARLAVAASAFGVYLRNTIVPLWLAPQCVKQWPAWPHFLIPGVVLSLAWGGFLCSRLRTRWEQRQKIVSVTKYEDCPVRLTFDLPPDYIFAGMAWFALAIAPMLGIASFGYHAHADRFTYIPSFGLAVLLAVALNGLARRYGASATAVPTAVVLAALSCLTWRQTGFWSDDKTLFSHTVEVDGDGNYEAHKIVALHHFEITHELEKARHHFEMALRANEQSLFGEMEYYVMTLVELGRDDEAGDVLRKYQDDIVKRLGEERAVEILRRTPSPGMPDAKLAVSYRFSRIARLLGKKPDLAEARQELEELRNWLEDVGTWQYLMWRCLTRMDERKAADELLKRLLDPSGKSYYAQYRFLRTRRN